MKATKTIDNAGIDEIFPRSFVDACEIRKSS